MPNFFDRLGLGESYVKLPDDGQNQGVMDMVKEALRGANEPPLREMVAARKKRPTLVNRITEEVEYLGQGYVPSLDEEQPSRPASKVVEVMRSVNKAPERREKRGPGVAKRAIGDYVEQQLAQDIVNTGTGLFDDIWEAIFSAPEPRERVDRGPGLLSRGVRGAGKLAKSMLVGAGKLAGAVAEVGAQSVMDSMNNGRRQRGPMGNGQMKSGSSELDSSGRGLRQIADDYQDSMVIDAKVIED